MMIVLGSLQTTTLPALNQPMIVGVALAYFAVVTGIGVWATRRTRSAADLSAFAKPTDIPDGSTSGFLHRVRNLRQNFPRDGNERLCLRPLPILITKRGEPLRPHIFCFTAPKS